MLQLAVRKVRRSSCKTLLLDEAPCTAQHCAACSATCNGASRAPRPEAVSADLFLKRTLCYTPSLLVQEHLPCCNALTVCCLSRQHRLDVSAQASSNGASSASGADYVEEGGFRIEQVCGKQLAPGILRLLPSGAQEARKRRYPLAQILTPIGVALLTYGFGSFFQLLPGSDIAALLLIYGFPITLLGFALSYAQLRPVPCKSTREALALRESQATDIQKQVRCQPRQSFKSGSTASEGRHWLLIYREV